jgi:hypothetical protein
MWAKIIPENERGVVELCLVRASREQVKPCLLFEYQQQRHIIYEGEDQVAVIESRTDVPIPSLLNASGFTVRQVAPARELYGQNKVRSHSPLFSSFPFTIFNDDQSNNLSIP